MQTFRDFSKKFEVRLQERLNFIQVVTGPRQVGMSLSTLYSGKIIDSKIIKASEEVAGSG